MTADEKYNEVMDKWSWGMLRDPKHPSLVISHPSGEDDAIKVALEEARKIDPNFQKMFIGGTLVGAALGVAGTLGYQNIQTNKKEEEKNKKAFQSKGISRVRFYDPKGVVMGASGRIHEAYNSKSGKWELITKKEFDNYVVDGNYERRKKSEGGKFVYYKPSEKMAQGGRFTEHYYLTVDLDERGEYAASVYDAKDHMVWDCDTESVQQLIEDGFLKSKPDEDLSGLTKYLSDNGKIRKGSEIISEEEFNNMKEEDVILEFAIPTWALPSLINGDDSGLNDEDIEKLNKFTDRIVEKCGNANFMLGSEENQEPYFCKSNDIDNLGSDCEVLLLRPTKEMYAQGGSIDEMNMSGQDKLKLLGIKYTTEFGDKYRSYINKMLKYNDHLGEYVGYQLHLHDNLLVIIGKKGTLTIDIKSYEKFPKGSLVEKDSAVHYADGGVAGFEEGWADLSSIKPSSITTEETSAFGNPDKLRLKVNGKTIFEFYYNMRGYNQNYAMRNKEGVHYVFGGDRSKATQLATFKRGLKDGFVFVKAYDKFAKGGEMKSSFSNFFSNHGSLFGGSYFPSGNKMASGGEMGNDKITTIIISSAAPLDVQLKALTGKGYTMVDFESPEGGLTTTLFTEISTGRKFRAVNIKEANDKGITGIQVPSESAIHEFFEMVKKKGERAAIHHYINNNLLLEQTVTSLLGGYATGATPIQEKILLAKNARHQHYRIHGTTHAQEKIEGREVENDGYHRFAGGGSVEEPAYKSKMNTSVGQIDVYSGVSPFKAAATVYHAGKKEENGNRSVFWIVNKEDADKLEQDGYTIQSVHVAKGGKPMSFSDGHGWKVEASKYADGGSIENHKIGDLVFVKDMGSRGLVGLVVSGKNEDGDYDVYYRGYNGDVIPTEESSMVDISEGHMYDAQNNGEFMHYPNIAKRLGITINPRYQELLDEQDDENNFDEMASGGIVNEEDLNEYASMLKDKGLKFYFLGLGADFTPAKIDRVEITPSKYDKREVLIYTSSKVATPIPLSQFHDFLKGKQIKIKDSSGEPYLMQLEYPTMRSVRVTYDDGTVIPTSMAAKLTDEEIYDYFAVGRTFNVGSGENDRMAKVKSVEILFESGGKVGTRKHTDIKLEERREILDKANEKGFDLVLNGKKHPAKLSGAKLDFPVAHTKDGYEAQVTWALAERLSKGIIKQVNG